MNGRFAAGVEATHHALELVRSRPSRLALNGSSLHDGQACVTLILDEEGREGLLTHGTHRPELNRRRALRLSREYQQAAFRVERHGQELRLYQATACDRERGWHTVRSPQLLHRLTLAYRAPEVQGPGPRQRPSGLAERRLKPAA